MEVIIALKFEIDEKSIGPRLGNRNGGNIGITMRDYITHIVGETFNKSPVVKLTYTGLCKRLPLGEFEE